MSKLIFLALALLGAKSMAQVTCQVSDLSPRLNNFLRLLGKEGDAQPAWFNYKLGNDPIVAFDAKSSKPCFAVRLPSGDVKVFSLNKVPQAKYFSYGYYRNRQAYPNFQGADIADVQDEVEASLRPLGVSYGAYVIFGSAQYDYEHHPELRKIPDLFADNVRTAIHEGFHFLIQDNVFGLNRAWTSFGKIELRDEELWPCYMWTDQIKSIHKQEVAAISQAFLAADTKDAKSLARKFLDLRKQRYSLAKPNSVTTTCEQAEAKQELHEGVPQLVGNAFILDQGLASPQQIIDEIVMTTDYYLNLPVTSVDRPIQSYYHIGSLEWLIIRRLAGQKFLSLTKEVSQSNEPFYLYKELDRWTSEK